MPKSVPSGGMHRRDWREALGVRRQVKGAEARQQVRDQKLSGIPAADSVQVGPAGGEPGQPDESSIQTTRESFACLSAGIITERRFLEDIVGICSGTDCTPMQLLSAARAASEAEKAAQLQHRPHPC